MAGEFIVPRGTTRTTWLAHDGNQWCLVRDLPGVVLTQQDPGPGVVWETLAECELPAGCWLSKIERRPRRDAFSDPMRYLEAEVRRAREQVRRQYFLVGSRGELRRPPPGATPPSADEPTQDEPDRYDPHSSSLSTETVIASDPARRGQGPHEK